MLATIAMQTAASPPAPMALTISTGIISTQLKQQASVTAA